jgi:hypothetical protein
MFTYVAFANYDQNVIHIARFDQPAYQDAPEYDVYCYAAEFVEAVNKCVHQLDVYMQDIPFASGTLTSPHNIIPHEEEIPY